MGSLRVAAVAAFLLSAGAAMAAEPAARTTTLPGMVRGVATAFWPEKLLVTFKFNARYWVVLPPEAAEGAGAKFQPVGD